MTKRIIRLLENGPEGQGLQPMTLTQADFHTPLPRQNIHVYFSDPALGLNVGVWDTTSMQEAFGPYPGDEFVVVLDGAFAMIDGNGRGIPAHKRQSVVFRNGTPVSWMQPGYLKKFFITLLDPKAQVPQVDSAEGGILVLDPEVELIDTDESTRSDSGAKQRDRVIFTNDAETMLVGLWDTEAMTTEPCASPCHKFGQVLDGLVTLTNEDGSNETFSPGDVFFIPQGTIVRWHVPSYMRMYYSTVTPSGQRNAPPDTGR